ncbi:S-layer homology domain-containing protein [Paenibacillus sp. MMO-177]|uniref:S-layer homology domain-containing protein n=1 Tax=Paenibacillus sp. MMO-177 TaxID=3081289 RepID=UPI003019AD11
MGYSALKNKRVFGIVLSVMMLFTLLQPGSLLPKASAASAVTLAKWDGTGTGVADLPANQNVTLDVNKDKKMTTSLSAVTFSNDASTPAMPVVSGKDWKVGDYWQVSLVSSGYTNLKVSSVQRGSNTGPRDFQLQYSLDGTTWNDVAGGTVKVQNDWTTGVLTNVALPSQADNQAMVYLRWTLVDNISVRAGTGSYSATDPLGATGTNQIENIVVTGDSSDGSGGDVGNGGNDNGGVQTSTPPVVNKITFVDDYATLNGDIGAVPANAEVKAYDADNMSLGNTTANADGSFTLTISNPTHAGTVTVTATETGKEESAKVNISVGQTAAPNATKITYSSHSTVSGTASAVAGRSAVTIYLADGTTPAGSTTAEADGSFTVSLSNADGNAKIYVTAKAANKLVSSKTGVDFAIANPNKANPGDVVFSMLNVSGSANGVYKNKFFELYNRTDHDISLKGWIVEYSALGTPKTKGSGTALNGTIKAHSYYLVNDAVNANGASAVPVTADASGSLGPNSGSSGGGIMILTQASTVTSDPTNENIVDLVAYGSASSFFDGKTFLWGRPFIASDIASGVMVRKTEIGSDPRAAVGMHNGAYFTKDPSKDFVTFVPKSAAAPSEIIMKNASYKETPVAANITFDGAALVSGAADAAVANSTVKAYAYVNGAFTAVGQTTAGLNGSFTMTIQNSTGIHSVYLTHAYANAESPYTRIDASSYTKPAIAAISDVRASDAKGMTQQVGYTTTVEGVITTANGVLGTEPTHFYVQDAAGGLSVIAGAVPSVSIVPGHKVKVTGTIVFTAGMVQLLASSIEDEGDQGLPAATKVELAQASMAATMEPLEGTLAVIKGKVTNTAASGADTDVTLTDDANNTFIVRVTAGSGIDMSGNTIALNETYSFTGIIGQADRVSPYDSGYRLMPRSATDVKGELQFSHTPLEKAYTRVDVSFEAMAKFADSVTLYYKGAEGENYRSVQLTAADKVHYNGHIPQSDVPTTGKLFYYIEAVSGEVKAGSGSSAEPIVIDIVEDKDGPAITSLSPAEGDKLQTQHPAISATYNDPSGIDFANATLKIDGVDYTQRAAFSATQATLTLTADDDLAVGDHTIQLIIQDALGNVTDKSWTFTIEARFSGGNHYYGTTHNHTNISHDAHGDPQTALDQAKYYGYDYFAFSDHSHDIDAAIRGTAGDAASHGGMPERKGGESWALTKSLAKSNTVDGQFVVFPAFEMTSTTWGHSNVFGTDNFIDRVEDGSMYQDLDKYYSWVMTYDDIVAQFNHPNAPTGAFNSFLPYNKQVDKLFTLFEVGNGSGNYSYVNLENLYYKALDIGWHVAPTFGEDNHDATWGQTKRRTVIVSKDLTTDSLMDAMRNMRVYMTEDPNAKLDATANGWYMGSTVDSKTLNFNISGSDDVLENKSDPHYSYIATQSNDNVAKVELITNGGVIAATYTPTSNQTSFNWKPTVTVAGGQQWFVVRVTQADGDRIYSAPFWSEEEAVAVKVGTVVAAEGAIIGGNAATLNASISNQGTETINGMTVSYYYDQQDSGHLIGQTTIDSLASGKSTTASVIWSNPVAGNHDIIVVLTTADATLNEYHQSFSIKAPLGKKILIDASKNNENTTKDTGSYKDNLKSFTNQMRLQGYTVAENTASTITGSALNGAAVLYISHPAAPYSADEITAIKNFVNNGGSVWLADKSNYGATNQNLNPLLEGIGSTIVLNNDEVVDETKDGNFWSTPLTSNYSVRLHPKPVSNYLTDFVSTIEYYSGSSLAKNSGGPVKAELKDSDTVTVLARGNESTFQLASQMKSDTAPYNVASSPAPADLTGGSAIPLIASETVGAGRIIVSGMNIFNDKQMDESFNAKGNNEFALNAINWLAHRETVVSSIAEARALPVGTDVVVQGTVTSDSEIFFDAFYLQDATGGIMAFNELPEHTLSLGDVVRVYGHISEFENNIELEYNGFAASVVKVSSGSSPDPKPVSTHDAVAAANLGQLVKVIGTVTSIPDSNSYVIDDGSGPLLVFADGYIVDQSGPIPVLSVGETLQAVGLSGGYSGGMRIRVRNTKELSKVEQTAAGLAAALTSLPAPAKDATSWTLPAAPTGFTYSIKSVTPTGVIATDGTVTPPSEATTVQVVVTVTKISDQSTAETAPIPVIVPAKTPSDNGNNGGNNGGNNSGSNNGGSTETPSNVTPVTADMLKQGVTTVALKPDTTAFSLPGNASELLGSHPLVLQSGSVELQLQPELLKQLTAQVSGTDLSKGTISIQMAPLSSNDASQAISRSENNSHSVIRVEGQIYEFSLSFTTAAGATSKLTQFNEPITLRLKVDPSAAAANPGLLGIFYIGDDGKLEYIGGDYANGVMTAEIRHFSKYAVLKVTHNFSDVTSGFWAYNVIQEMAAKQIVNGTSDTAFEPNRAITRGEFTKLLVNALKLTASTTKSFADVPGSAYYAEPISIAYSNGIVTGRTATTFDPQGIITREEMVAMMMRAYEVVKKQPIDTVNESSFADIGTVSGWAKNYVNAAAKLKLINGRSGNKFVPKGITTRAEAVQAIYNLMNK